MSKNAGHTFLPKDVLDYSKYRWEKDTTTLVFSDNMKVPFQTVSLQPGKYVIEFTAEVRENDGTLPVMRLLLGYNFIKDDSIIPGVKNYAVRFEIKEKSDEPIQFQSINNDLSISGKKKNIYLHFPVKVVPY
jgi:hypothetical protein